MIQTFLCSLAALLRQLIAQGRAVHCTEADAAELELLAGLPWGESGYESVHSKPGAKIWVASPEPADIALGWLRASKAALSSFDYRDDQDVIEAAEESAVERAAACAELVALCPYAATAPDPTPEQYREMLEKWGQGEAKLEPYVPPLPMHAQGTIEGARAVWNFIQSQLQPPLKPIISSQFGMVALHSLNQDLEDLAKKYRRELEAMK